MIYALLMVAVAVLAATAPYALFYLLALGLINWVALIEMKQISADLAWLSSGDC